MAVTGFAYLRESCLVDLRGHVTDGKTQLL